MTHDFARPISVSVIVPCRNEAGHIRRFLNALLEQNLDGICAEVLIADGMSDDGTREIIQDFCSRYSRAHLVDNPVKIVPVGLNAAILQSSGEIIVRMDVHTEYAPDYIRQCILTLGSTAADNVGGPARTHSRGYMQTAVELAYHSPFAVGGARFHDVDYEGFVDTVPYGCWRKDTLLGIGLFDEELVRNQDDELNLRLVRAGKTVWQSPSIYSWYSPRSSLKGLFCQYSQYGYWKVRVIQKHRLPASIRHLIPGGFIGSLIALSILSAISAPAFWVLVLLLAFYALANLAASLVTCYKPQLWRFLPVMPLVFGAYHFGYGYGFLHGVLDFMLLQQKGRKSYTHLTRSSGMPLSSSKEGNSVGRG